MPELGFVIMAAVFVGPVLVAALLFTAPMPTLIVCGLAFLYGGAWIAVNHGPAAPGALIALAAGVAACAAAGLVARRARAD